MKHARLKQAAMTIAATATVSAVVGLATGMASSSKSNSNDNPPRVFEYGTAVGPGPGRGLAIASAIARNGKGRMTFSVPGGGPVPFQPFGGPPVHSEMVVPNRSGDGFITVTNDDGKVDSVSGSQLTITEGTAQATYKTVTLDIPGDAKVVRDGEKAQLSDLQNGDQVHVSVSPNGSFVFATDDAFQKKMQREFRQHFKDVPKPPAGVPGGMPPGLPPMLGRRGH
jgi:hypothetical protein